MDGAVKTQPVPRACISLAILGTHQASVPVLHLALAPADFWKLNFFPLAATAEAKLHLQSATNTTGHSIVYHSLNHSLLFSRGSPQGRAFTFVCLTTRINSAIRHTPVFTCDPFTPLNIHSCSLFLQVRKESRLAASSSPSSSHARIRRRLHDHEISQAIVRPPSPVSHSRSASPLTRLASPPELTPDSSTGLYLPTDILTPTHVPHTVGATSTSTPAAFSSLEL